MSPAVPGRRSAFLRRRSRWWLTVPGVLIVLAIGVVAADYFLDEPFRRELERRMNDRLEGYRVTVRTADVHLLGVAFDLGNLVVVQQAHPDPPVARIHRLSVSVHWRALLHGAVVANVEFARPEVYVDL